MEPEEIVDGFLDRIGEDPRIGPAHISLFVAILHCCESQDYRKPVSVYGRDLRKLAKIGGSGLYHRCMRDLKEGGYIGYVPSFNPALGSLVFIVNQEP